jgi:hypothetical protein
MARERYVAAAGERGGREGREIALEAALDMKEIAARGFDHWREVHDPEGLLEPEGRAALDEAETLAADAARARAEAAWDDWRARADAAAEMGAGDEQPPLEFKSLAGCFAAESPPPSREGIRRPGAARLAEVGEGERGERDGPSPGCAIPACAGQASQSAPRRGEEVFPLDPVNSVNTWGQAARLYNAAGAPHPRRRPTGERSPCPRPPLSSPSSSRCGSGRAG